MKNNNRVKSGAKAKKQGHSFEESFADLHEGLETKGGSRTKIDIEGTYKGYKNLSLKNPSGKNTQVWLPSQKTLFEALNLSKISQQFVKQFFGGDDYSDYNKNRVPLEEIAEYKSNSFLNEFNNKLSELFHLIFTHGHNMTGSVEALGWANEKNNLDSLKFYDLSKLKKDFVEKGKWTFSSRRTTLHFHIGNKKLLHLQMKGSGKKPGYHYPQFHLHGNFHDSWIIND